MLWVRAGVVMVGAYLAILGIGKIYWEIKSWEVLSEMEIRPALYPDGPRVRFRIYVFIAAVGLSMVVFGVLPW